MLWYRYSTHSAEETVSAPPAQVQQAFTANGKTGGLQVRLYDAALIVDQCIYTAVL